MGVPLDKPIILYDVQGMYAVARAAWIFRYYGAKNVRILNGGLKKWIMEGRPTFKGEQKKTEGGDYSFCV